MGPATKKQLSEELVAEEAMSVSRACKLTGLPRSQFYYKSVKDDQAVIAALQKLSGDHPTYGFRKLFAYLRRGGHQWNHKKVYRVYLLLKMNKRWSMDFMSDALVDGRKFRTFNVMDDCNREALAVEVDTSLSSKRIIRVLDRLIEQRGKPKSIRVDNGPEFTSKDFEWWCKEKEINIQFIQPGRPMQNGFIERFNGSYRTEILNAYLFFDLYEVRKLTEQWMEEYNYRRPHEGLQGATPHEWKEQLRCGNMENSAIDTMPTEFTTLPHRNSNNSIFRNSTEKTV